MFPFFGPGSSSDIFEHVKEALDGLSLARLLSACSEAQRDPSAADLQVIRGTFCGLARYLDEAPLRWPGFDRADNAEVWFGLVPDTKQLPRNTGLDGSVAPPSVLTELVFNASQAAMGQWIAKRRRLRGLDPVGALAKLNPEESESPLFLALLEFFRVGRAAFFYSPVDNTWLDSDGLDPDDAPQGPVLTVALTYKGFSAVVCIWSDEFDD